MLPSQPGPATYAIGADQSLILDQVDDAVALVDSNHRLILFNQKLLHLWCLDESWLQSQPTLEAVLDQLVAAGHWTQSQRQQVWQLCQLSPEERHSIQVAQPDQTYLEIHATATSDGGVLLIVRDLTTQQRYQILLAEEVRRLSFLLGLTERLQTSDNLLEIGRFALSYLVQTLGASFGDVKVIGGQGNSRRAGLLTNEISGQFIATYGEPVVVNLAAILEQGIPYGQGILWDVVDSGKPVFVDDYGSHPKAIRQFCQPGIGQLAIFPIPAADGTIIGVLTLESRKGSLAEAPNQDMVLAACRTLGASIERATDKQRLEQINQDLEQASRLKSEFLASMSHELRTPLNSVLGFSELMLRDQQLDTRKSSHVRAIKRSGEHLLNLINDILDLSKIEAGKVELALETVPIQDLCNECLGMIHPRAERKQLSLSLEMDYRIDRVTVDQRRVRQMIINLLSNAVKFTPEKGQIKLAISLAYGSQLSSLETRVDDSPVNPSTPYICIAVTDTGIGIPKDKQQLLFQPFQQIDAALNRRHDGTGLGLCLTRRLAELHNGTLSFRSAPDQGSCFRIWLPANELRQPPGTLTSPSARSRFGSPLLNPSHPGHGRVLVVEDHPCNQTLLAEMLEIEGFAMELVDNGQTMAELIDSPLATSKTLPDIVLMDIQLPDVDGLTLIRQLKAHPLWRRVPVMAVTAMAMGSDQQACYQAGADDYISKPLNFPALVQKIRRLIDPDRGEPDLGAEESPLEG